MMNKKRKFNKNTFTRVIKDLFKFYPALAPITAFCILFSAVTAAVPDVLIQKIIAVIEKWQVSGNWSSAYTEVIPSIAFLIVLYIIALIAVVINSQLMAYITQGFLSKMRCKMFDSMQTLPVKYFDTHKHGDIMSHYTNDIDTLRQLISQSLP